MFAASFCACRSHWLQWDTCLFKSRNMAVSYGQFFFPPTVHIFLPHSMVPLATCCVFWRIILFAFSIKAITHTHVFLFLHTILLTCMRRYICVVGKRCIDLVQISKPLLLTVLLTRIFLLCLPEEAGACYTSIPSDRRESPALTKRNKYRMLMAGNVHRAANNIFDKILSIASVLDFGWLWQLLLSFTNLGDGVVILLQFLINVAAIKSLLVEESFK